MTDLTTIDGSKIFAAHKGEQPTNMSIVFDTGRDPASVHRNRLDYERMFPRRRKETKLGMCLQALCDGDATTPIEEATK